MIDVILFLILALGLGVVIWATIDIISTNKEIEKIDKEIAEMYQQKSDLDSILMMDLLNRVHALEERMNGNK